MKYFVSFDVRDKNNSTSPFLQKTGKKGVKGD
jgi:hypothetical protein